VKGWLGYTLYSGTFSTQLLLILCFIFKRFVTFSTSHNKFYFFECCTKAKIPRKHFALFIIFIIIYLFYFASQKSNLEFFFLLAKDRRQIRSSSTTKIDNFFEIFFNGFHIFSCLNSQF